MATEGVAPMKVFTKTGHITEESLSLYAVRDLPLSAGARIEQHLTTCHLCRKTGSEVDEIVRLLRMAAARCTHASRPIRRPTLS